MNKAANAAYFTTFAIFAVSAACVWAYRQVMGPLIDGEFTWANLDGGDE